MKIFIFLTTIMLVLYSCSENSLDTMQNEKDAEDVCFNSSRLSLQQALSYASIFNSALEQNDSPESSTRATTPFTRVVSDINFCIEGNDTLLYAINYMNNEGYILLSGDNSSFPILSYSSKGNLNLSEIPENSSIAMYLSAVKTKVRNNINSKSSTETDYFNEWKDLGRNGYEYEIEINNDEPIDKSVTRANRTRKNSCGKASIYPYTGKDLDNWCQEGGYNMYTPNNTYIGCAALAIGMLLYDVSQRTSGNYTKTFPNFSFDDRRDLTNVTDSTEVARKLRQIADSIPDYRWASSKNESTIASSGNIARALWKLGFTKTDIVSFNLDTLYNHLSFKGKGYFGEDLTFNRGILIGASDSKHETGHVWFCDGYYEQSYTVRKKFLGIVIREWTEYDDRLYMNWGWGAKGGNGWYLATDNVWSSNEGNKSVDYKLNPLIYINLGTYVKP